MGVFATGDTHRREDIAKLSPESFDQGQNLTKDDYLIVAGDYGALWSGDADDDELLDWWEDRPWTTLFVDGNHENFELLEALPRRSWHGGLVGEARPSVLHLRRGQLFDLDGLRVWTMGGAVSEDRFWRKEGRNWWPQELPSQDEREAALAALDQAGWRVDCVLTHEGPTRAILALYETDENEMNAWLSSLEPEFFDDYAPTHEWTGWLDEVAGRLSFAHWYFGHRHKDAALGRIGASAGDFRCLYNDVVRLT